MRVKITIRIISVFISEELQRKGYSTFPMLKFSGYLPLKFLLIQI